MKIFVSSRLEELRNERKVVVEVLHFLGHTPLYVDIEEPESSNIQSIVDGFLDSAEALILLYYLSMGDKATNENRMSWIKYEYSKFRNSHPTGKILFIGKITDVPPLPDLEKWISEQKKKEFLFIWDHISENDELNHNFRLKNFLICNYSSYSWVEDASFEKNSDNKTINLYSKSNKDNYLSLKLNEKESKVTMETEDGMVDEFIAEKEKGKISIYKISNLKDLKFETGELTKTIIDNIQGWKMDTPSHITDHKIIRYTGPDFIGLILSISRILHNKKLNMDFLSHASRGGIATIYITCSPRDKQVFREELEFTLNLEVAKYLKIAKDNGKLVDNAEKIIEEAQEEGKIAFEIKVHEDTTIPYREQFFIELRAIDSPGQIYKICETLKNLDMNIDNMYFGPTSPEFKRQTAVSLWVSHFDRAPQKISYREVMVKLETKLNKLMGIRACSIRHHPRSLYLFCWDNIKDSLFNWNGIGGKADNKLIHFLNENYDIASVDPEVEIFDNAIRVNTNKKIICLKLNNAENKVIIKIDKTEEMTEKYTAILENGDLNIYPSNNDNIILKQFLKHNYNIDWINSAKIEKIYEELFNWDKVSDGNFKELRDVLSQKFRNNWIINMKDVNNEKNNDNKTIRISKNLFEWNTNSTTNDEKLIEFIQNRFNIDCVKKAKLQEINYYTKKLSLDDYYFILRLNEDKTRIHIEMYNGRTEDLLVKNNKGKLIIYYLLSLKLNNKKNKVTLEINRKKIDEFVAKMENNERKIYVNDKIKIFTEINSLLLKLNSEKNRVILEIDGKNKDEFIAKEENDSISVYNSSCEYFS